MEYRAIGKEEFEELQGRILYEDNHILAVDKRPGDIVQGDKTGDECLCETYKAFIAQRDGKPGRVFLGIPHRLDRPVGGITLLAKTSKGLERISESFREGKVHKTYYALCVAPPPEKEALLEDWLLRREDLNKSFVVHEPSAGRSRRGEAKLAKLIYTYVGATERYHLLKVQLLTGRHHQIRCQLSNIGCIIKGDLKYGAPRSNPDGSICLHAAEITFPHPVSKEAITLRSPLPRSWKGVEGLIPKS